MGIGSPRGRKTRANSPKTAPQGCKIYTKVRFFGADAFSSKKMK